MIERRVDDPVDAQEGVERTAIAFMSEFDTGNVVGRGAGFLRGCQDPVRGHIDEGRGRVDETPDQPRAGDPVDLRPLPRHPLRWSLSLFCPLAPKRKILLVPGAEATGEIGGGGAGGIQGLCNALADLLPMRAIDHQRPVPGQAVAPTLYPLR